jgi:hypothetical protein
MPKWRTAAIVASAAFLSVASAGAIAAECTPHCDYIQDYGPYDYTYVRPGLFGYAICDWWGNCSPYRVYAYSGRRTGRITIRSLSRPQ